MIISMTNIDVVILSKQSSVRIRVLAYLLVHRNPIKHNTRDDADPKTHFYETGAKTKIPKSLKQWDRENPRILSVLRPLPST